MMMLDYKGGRGGGGVKNLGKSDYVISQRSLIKKFVNFCQNNWYLYLQCFNFMSYLC